MRLPLSSVFIALSCYAFAQRDTAVYLTPVQILGSNEEYTEGMKVSKVDSSTILAFNAASLGELLQETTGVYFRKYGAEGQLTSVSFRGTTSSHTRVSWNHIDINSQTLGQSDFSSISAFLFSDVTLYHGASSVVFGSGSIGGTIELGSSGIPGGYKVLLSESMGSYGKWFTGVKSSYGGLRWGMAMAAEHTQVNNDFSVDYRNTTYKQNNAASKLSAIQGNGYYDLGNHSKITFDIWYNRHDREVQPVIGDEQTEDHLLDNNFRLNVGFRNAGTRDYYRVALSYIDDRQTYNFGSQTNLKRYIIDGEYEFSLFEKLTFRSGGQIVYARPDVSSYDDGLSQIRSSAFVLTSWKPISSVSVSANVRMAYVEGQHYVPMVPSFGAEYRLHHTASDDFSILAQVAKSFRFPTLNDLYWQPGGNPDLKPEKGVSLESGVKYKKSNALINWQSSLAVYTSRINNMIVWVPRGSFWSPDNVSKVQIRGLEAETKFQLRLGGINGVLSGNYNYNHSENRSDDEQLHGNQLAYVPFHKAAFGIGILPKQWSFFYRQSYTGKRYTELSNNSHLQGYSVGQMEISRAISWKESEWSIVVQVKNLWDKDYQNYELRATPGRNYLIKINYQINQSK